MVRKEGQRKGGDRRGEKKDRKGKRGDQQRYIHRRGRGGKWSR